MSRQIISSDTGTGCFGVWTLARAYLKQGLECGILKCILQSSTLLPLEVKSGWVSQIEDTVFLDLDGELGCRDTCSLNCEHSRGNH